MDEGKIVAWRKREGDRVEAGEILFEVETDKATMEVEASTSGFVRKILIGEGMTAPVASTIALITESAEEPLGDMAVVERPTPQQPAAESATTGPTPMAALEGERVRSSPAARKRAQELGVDIASVNGTGPGGRITIEDVEAAAAGHAAGGAATPGAASAKGGRRIPLTRMRRAIADAMTRSAAVPQFQIARDVDMTAADAMRKGVGASYTDVLVAACAQALVKHERFRARFDGDALMVSDAVNVGIAVALDDGLIVPVLHDADRKDLATLRSERERLEEGARAGKLPADALTGASFTVSNLGTLGVDRFTALVNPPEAAILAVGRVSSAKMLTLTLTVDHRVADGADAARFLAEIAGWLERGGAGT
jgi:pyruvate dehydrogenase E2 component (dihydrolipoamide acetyltransferase)